MSYFTCKENVFLNDFESKIMFLILAEKTTTISELINSFCWFRITMRLPLVQSHNYYWKTEASANENWIYFDSSPRDVVINFDVAKVFNIQISSCENETQNRRITAVNTKIPYHGNFNILRLYKGYARANKTRSRTIKIIDLFFFFEQMIKKCSRKA